jgi:acyl-CoA thioesterase-2
VTAGAQSFEELLSAIDLRSADGSDGSSCTDGSAQSGRFSGGNVSIDGDGRVAYGGLFLSQAIVAAGRCIPGRAVRSIQTLFARSGRRDTGFEIGVTVLHEGATFASAAVTNSQGDRDCTTSLVLFEQSGSDTVAGRQPPAPPLADLRDATVSPFRFGGADVRFGTDPQGEHAFVWCRFPTSHPVPAVRSALLAYLAEPFFLAAALAVSAPTIHRFEDDSTNPAIVAMTVTFHRDYDPSEWVLFTLRIPNWQLISTGTSANGHDAGRARFFGTADVFATDGTLIAQVNQDCMLRPVPLP